MRSLLSRLQTFWIPLFLAGITAQASASASSFELVTDVKSPEVQQWLRAAESLLPPKLKLDVGRAIPVRFVRLTPKNTGLPRCEDQAMQNFRLGETDGKTVYLNQLLLEEIRKGEAASSTLNCGHGNYYRQATAALLHEVSHIYDFDNFQPPTLAGMISWCKAKQEDHGSVIPGCQEYLEIDRTVSRSKLYMDLAGWVKTGFIFVVRSQVNQLESRSPDPYEFKNLDEHFAVNMEYFLLDPDYGCRKPSLQRFFVNHFGFDPHPNRECKVGDRLLVSTTLEAGTTQQLFPIDRMRLYEIHYLFASEGKQVMSRWGHAMYRLVFCSPDRKEVGPECLKDVRHHLVVSFRANIEDFILSQWGGLTGRYPSQLFVMPLLQVLEEYNSGELRDILSLPLKLRETDRDEFLNRILELQWSYQGKYYFLGNNCATESLNLLRSTLDTDTLRDTITKTPLGLFKFLKSTGIGDADALSDLARARDSGHYFPSRRNELNRSFRLVQEPGEDLDQYIEETGAAERKERFRSRIEGRSKEEIRSLAASFYLLEEFVRRRADAALGKEVPKLVIQAQETSDPELAPVISDLKEFQRLAMTNPFSELIRTGYGVPTQTDFDQAQGRAELGERRKSTVALFDRLIKWLDQRFAEQKAELRRIGENKKTFAKTLAGG